MFLPRRHARSDESVTFTELTGDIDRLAAGLAAMGIERHSRVALLAENRYEWLLADLAITYIGAVDVPRGSDTAPAEMEFILRHSGSQAAIVQDDRTAREVMAQKDRLPDLGPVITMAPETTVDDVLTLPAVMAQGDDWIAEHPGRLRELAAAVQPDDLFTIVYTSGTTAEPKGVMLTHHNVLSNVRYVCDVLDITDEDGFLSVLPAWHMYERIMDYLALAAGATLTYTDRRHLKDDLRKVEPTVFAAVPRIWESIHDGIVNHAHKCSGIQGKLLRSVIDLCRTIGAGEANVFQRAMHALCRVTILRKLRAITGTRLRLAVSGGGALPRHIDECMLGIGFPLRNGYGLTETSPVAAIRGADDGPGTIGRPIPHTEIHARDSTGRVLEPGQTGLLWIRGPQVMTGYYRNPRKTAEALDEEGWFNSGDLGYVDADGKVWITGRAKDTIVLSGGENVEPEPVETAIKTSPYIEQVVAVGQDRKTLGALVVPARDCLEKAVPRTEWEEREGFLEGKAVRDLVRKELDRLLTSERGFRPVERVAAFRVMLEPLTPDNGYLTQTLKVRRHVVSEKLAPVIDAMFS